MTQLLRHALFIAAVFMIGPAVAQDSQMARVPLMPPDTKDPILAPIFDGVRARGGEPLNLHRAFGNAPNLFKAYSDLAIAIRSAAAVPRADRELIILRLTQLSKGDYEFVQHRPMAMSCGMTATQIDALSDWRGSTLFDERQRAILAYADGMVSAQGVDEAVFGELKRFFSVQEIVELTITASFYYGSSLGTRALGVQLEQNVGQTAYGKC